MSDFSSNRCVRRLDASAFLALPMYDSNVEVCDSVMRSARRVVHALFTYHNHYISHRAEIARLQAMQRALSPCSANSVPAGVTVIGMPLVNHHGRVGIVFQTPSGDTKVAMREGPVAPNVFDDNHPVRRLAFTCADNAQLYRNSAQIAHLYMVFPNKWATDEAFASACVCGVA